jgi:hypothetical protein
VADDQGTQYRTQSEQNESLLISRVGGVVNQDGAIIREDGLSFLERNPVAASVAGILLRVPLEP